MRMVTCSLCSNKKIFLPRAGLQCRITCDKCFEVLDNVALLQSQRSLDVRVSYDAEVVTKASA
jgi:hypothetical protein